MQPIVLIGFMGSGKSSVARHLSRLLQREVTDLDCEVEKRTGTTVAQFFASQGEDAFRRLETEVLRQSLSNGALLATGGGVIKRDENRAVLAGAIEAGGLVVYLKAKPETLAARIRRQPGSRPLIDGDGHLNYDETVARVRELLDERAQWYTSCANCVVSTDELSTAQVAAAIAELAHI